MSFPRHERYKDSGVEWLGEVPAHWRFSKTKTEIRFQTGWTPPSGSDKFYGGGIPWATISDLVNRTIRETAITITSEAVQMTQLKPVSAGSLLFSFKLSIGQVAFTGCPMYTNEAIAAFEQSPTISLQYAYFAFPFFLAMNAAENIYGAKLLNQELINNALLLVPPIEEQRFLSQFLDQETAKIDALIEEQRRLIALLKEKRQAVISHAVTKGLDPDVPMKDSGAQWLQKVPLHWSAVPLGYLVRFFSGGTPDKTNEAFWDGAIPWVSPKDMKVEQILDSQDHVSDLALSQGGLHLFESDHVLVVVRGMILAHSFPVARNRVPVTINQDMKAIHCGERLAASFLQELFAGVKELIVSYGEESAHGTLKIDSSVLSSLCIPLPPPEEQTQIVKWLDEQKQTLDTLSVEVASAINLLQERRSALISAAVTGKIDVRNYSPQSTATPEPTYELA